jgi:hypothetical protein
MLELVMCNLTMLTIAMIYYTYRDSRPRVKPNLNERVAYMLWVAAQRNS